MNKFSLTAIAAVLCGVCGVAQAEHLVIHAGTLIDGVNDKAMKRMTVEVKDDRIVSVKSGYNRVAGATVIDLKDHTVMPGFIDLHTHIDTYFSASSYAERYSKDPADYAFDSVGYAKVTLDAGFTTIRNLGGVVSLSLRDAINTGKIDGPRIFAAGRALASTGGHGDTSNGYNHQLSHLLGPQGPAQGIVNGPIAGRAAIRQLYKDGADVVKLTVTGGVLSLAKSGDNPQFMADELDAIMSAAKDYNFVVGVHAHGAEGMKRAVEAGVDSVEHGTYMTKEIMQLMKDKGTYYVPTLTAGRWVADNAKSYPKIIQPKAAAIGPQIQETFRKAYEFGVKIAFGSDSGVFPHGLNGREFVYMVEAGMPEMEAIQAATSSAAELLRMQDDLGSVSAGKYADFVAVKGNPLDDISLLTDVDFVMKGGDVVKQK